MQLILSLRSGYQHMTASTEMVVIVLKWSASHRSSVSGFGPRYSLTLTKPEFPAEWVRRQQPQRIRHLGGVTAAL